MERLIADRFVIERLVGSGGMGEVWRARDRLSGGLVAMKILYTSMLRDAERFRREAQLLAEIAHPRIVKYVAHGLLPEGNRPWLAMEWLEGEDLASRLERSGLSLHETLLLVRRTAEALAALHDKGIVHRDVKPSNIFLPAGDVAEAKVLDLGVARLMRSTRPSTRSGVMVGTPGYMAPEQARGAKEVDARADIFALGCVAYECLAARPAFAGENIAALLAKILIETPESLRAIGVDVPPEVDDLVMRMLSKHVASRPGSGRAVLKELETFTEVKDAPPQRPSGPAIRALTAGERRLVCVVMALGPTPVAPSQPELGTRPVSAETVDAQLDPRAIATSFGAEAELLADGSLVATLGGQGGQGGASEQAAQAARCALAIRAHLPDASVVLATGLATMTGRSAVGEVIERAAALLASARAREGGIDEETTQHGQRPIFLDETTAGLLDPRFDVGGDDRGLFIRGLRERDARARTLLGKHTPFVGRDRELSTLLAIYEECAGEPVARAVLVTGFPGAGKSRLAAELLRRLGELEPEEGRHPPEVLVARGDAMTHGAPFALVARLLRRAAQISGGEPLGVRQQKLRARVARNVGEPDLQRVTEFLGEIASIPFSDAESVQLRAARQDAILMGDQMRRAFCDLVLAETKHGPLVLVLEDLHWGDLPSVTLLDAALRAANEQSFMVLAVARGDVHDAFPQLWAQRSLQEVRLGPLVRRAGERLVRDVLGDDLPAVEMSRLLDRAAGNAFYLEELIRAYAEGTGRARKDESSPAVLPGTTPPPASSSTSLAADGWSLPTTVLAMVEARLERLDPMARRVLRAASIFGESFWRSGVLALTGGQYKASEIDEWLGELKAREIVQRREVSRFPGDQEYVFRHAIVRDAAYQMLTPDDQKLGHRLAGEWLERAGEYDPLALGEHFERGGNLARAAGYYSRAAIRALDANDFAAAKSRAERALRAGSADGTSSPDTGPLELVLAEASRWSGEHAAARTHAVTAMQSLDVGSDDWYAAAAEAGEAAITLGYVEEARALTGRLRAIAPSHPITVARIIATTRVAIAVGYVGLYDEASALLEQVHEGPPVCVGTGQEARSAGVSDVIGREPSARGFLLSASVARASWEGDLEHAAGLAQEAASCFELVGDARNAARHRYKAGFALSQLGAYAVAERVLRQAAHEAAQLGLLTVADDARLAYAQVYVRSGRKDEGVAIIEEVIAAYAAQHDRVNEGRARAYLAGAYYFSGDHERAELEERAALPLLEHAPPYLAALMGFMTLTLLNQGKDPEVVYLAGAQAMQLLEKVGNVAEGEALIRVAYAEALNWKGDLEGRKRAIIAARDRLLARAAKITNPEYKRTFMTVVQEHVRTLARAGEWLI